MREYVKGQNPISKSNCFYAIAKIKDVELKIGHEFGSPHLAFPQPTIQSIEIELADGKKVRIRAIDKDKEIDELRELHGITGGSFLLTKSANKNTTSKGDRPYHAAVIVDERNNEGGKSFVFVHFSGLQRMTEKMKRDQETAVAVNGWFTNYILGFE